VGGIDRAPWAPYHGANFFEIGFETVEICVIKVRNWQNSSSHNFCLTRPILMYSSPFGRTVKDLQNALLVVAVGYATEILLIKNQESENPENRMPAGLFSTTTLSISMCYGAKESPFDGLKITP
jgi:hypothetical protein